jgi:hypothetical protein
LYEREKPVYDAASVEDIYPWCEVANGEDHRDADCGRQAPVNPGQSATVVPDAQVSKRPEEMACHSADSLEQLSQLVDNDRLDLLVHRQYWRAELNSLLLDEYLLLTIGAIGEARKVWLIAPERLSG